MRRTLLVVWAVVVASFGCSQGDEPAAATMKGPVTHQEVTVDAEPGPEEDVDGAAPEPVEPTSIRISGEVFLREPLALPADAELVVRLFAGGRHGDPGRQIAAVRLPVSRRPPTRFELSVPQDEVAAGTGHAITASIFRRGVEVFSTDSPVPVLEPGRPSKDLRLLLRRIG